jgi:hypothetical protein
MDLIVETEIACPHCGQSFPLPKASKARNSDCPRHWNRFGAPTRFAQFVGPEALNHWCKVTGKQGCHGATNASAFFISPKDSPLALEQNKKPPRGEA